MFTIEFLFQKKIKNIVVATSTDQSDDVLAEHCYKKTYHFLGPAR